MVNFEVYKLKGDNSFVHSKMLKFRINFQSEYKGKAKKQNMLIIICLIMKNKNIQITLKTY